MPRYLVAIHHRDDYDASAVEDEAMSRDIDALNEEMVAAGVRVFVGGLQPPDRAAWVRVVQGGSLHAAAGPYLKTDEHVAGFWVLDTADEDEAMVWARKAAVACRAPVEVRRFN